MDATLQYNISATVLSTVG